MSLLDLVLRLIEFVLPLRTGFSAAVARLERKTRNSTNDRSGDRIRDDSGGIMRIRVGNPV